MNKAIRLVIIFVAVSLIFICGLSAVTSHISAQTEDKAAAALPPEARQFDFWLGNWNGVIAGSGSAPNSITAFGVGGGIAILESFAGGSGTSVSFYSVKDQKWYQTWFDSDQLLIEVTGEFQNGRMVLTGQETRTTTGAKLVGRESWFNISDNRYDFTYEVSPNGGQTFQTAFSARFTRNTASSSSPEESAVGSQNLAPAMLPSNFRQLDFLTGDWEVTTQDCQSAATANVTLFGQGGGIAVLEDFRCGGYRGTSVSMYNTVTDKWHYMWLDTDGLLLELTGNRQGDDMVFEGEFDDPVSGQTRLARVTYDRISGSAIDRKFEVSEDGGQTWAIRRTDHYAKATVFQPEAFKANKIKSSKVKLGWTDNSPAENRFEVLQLQGDQWVVVKTYSANTTSATIKRLQSGTEYRFAVRACDSDRCSAQAEITVTTR